jgi:lysozyme family protein
MDNDIVNDPNQMGMPLRPNLQLMFNEAVISPEFEIDADLQAKRIIVNKLVYESLQSRINSPDDCFITWFTIGVIHAMEGNCSLKNSIEDGEPLREGISWLEDARQVLSNRPKRGLDGFLDLEYIERHNGFGYRTHGIYSPYLWSGTQFYTKGKYGSDGQYDPELVSRQVGAVPVLIHLAKLIG